MASLNSRTLLLAVLGVYIVVFWFSSFTSVLHVDVLFSSVLFGRSFVRRIVFLSSVDIC